MLSTGVTFHRPAPSTYRFESMLSQDANVGFPRDCSGQLSVAIEKAIDGLVEHPRNAQRSRASTASVQSES